MSSYASIGQNLNPSQSFGKRAAASPAKAPAAAKAAAPVPAAAPAAAPVSPTAAAVPSKRIAGFGIVKSVESGDSIIIVGSAPSGQIPAEKRLTLSGIQVPKLGRRTNPDEPWAHQSKEFLRKKLIGRQVKFTINYVADGGREYAIIELNGENVNNAIIAAGWGICKPGKPGATIHPERQELMDLQDAAEKAGIGMHDKKVQAKDQVRKVNNKPNEKELFMKYRNKVLPGIVDFVRDGSTFRVELIGKFSSILAAFFRSHLFGGIFFLC